MSLKLNTELMADYNQWMNKRIYETAAKLSSNELWKDRGAYFNSIGGTLNHILVGDILWLKRFTNHPSKPKTLDYVRTLEDPKALDTILHTEFDDLKKARFTIDGVILSFAQELTDDALSSTLTYSSIKGKSFNKNFGHLIQHFFNHQTHHRGQISTLLSQAGMDVGVTDLLAAVPDQ